MWGHGVLGMEDKRRPRPLVFAMEWYCQAVFLTVALQTIDYTVTQDTIWGVLWVFPGTDALPDGSSHP